jgi:carboxymethylenebutenolidase
MTMSVAIGLALAAGQGSAQDASAQDASAQDVLPERVNFGSADGKTNLVGYVYAPAQKSAARVPAVVMMHGRQGAYSTLAKGRYVASTLSQRHQMWGRLWAQLGYVAIMVDGFGPRGYPQGFGRHTYDDRPSELNEVTIRPLDAYGALAWLRTRDDVLPDRIGLQGWSNGGSTTLATMAAGTGMTPAPGNGFTAALAFYPACGLKGAFDKGYKPYAPVRVFMGTADEEVSYRRCRGLVEGSRAQGGTIEIKLYQGATHSFDDPGRNRQRVRANTDAKADAMGLAQQFFGQMLAAPKGAVEP